MARRDHALGLPLRHRPARTSPMSSSAPAYEADGRTGTLELEVHVGLAAGSPSPAGGSAAELTGPGLAAPTLLEADVPAAPPRGRRSHAGWFAGPPRRGELDVISEGAAGVPWTPRRRRAGRDAPAGPDRGRGRPHWQPASRAWSRGPPRFPARYRLDVALAGPDGAVVERLAGVVGFRSVEVVGNELLINGRAVLIRGVNRHDFDPATGRVVRRSHARGPRDR